MFSSDCIGSAHLIQRSTENLRPLCLEWRNVLKVKPLTHNDPYRGRTATLTSKRCILCIYSTSISTEYFKHGIYSPFLFPLQNAVCFIILTYLVPILFTFLYEYITFIPLTPYDSYRGRTATLTSKRCILCIYSTSIGTEYFKHGIYSPFFLFKMQFVS